MLISNKKRPFLKCLLILCLCVAWAFLLSHCAKEEKPPSALAPDFTLKTLDGQEITLSLHDALPICHIPYVVHASTKPVLSEPSTLRPFDRLTAQGERLSRRVMLTFYETIKH